MVDYRIIRDGIAVDSQKCCQDVNARKQVICLQRSGHNYKATWTSMTSVMQLTGPTGHIYYAGESKCNLVNVPLLQRRLG